MTAASNQAAPPTVRVLDGPAADLRPTAVAVVDLERPQSLRYPVTPPAAHHVRTRMLVRRNGVPLGFVEVDSPEGALPEGAVEAAERALGAGAAAHRPEPSGAAYCGPVTVVVCTRDRADMLRRCLRSVLDNAGADVEIVVVDNAPRTDATRQVVGGLADPRLRYVLEERPGLSVARNRGLREASHELVVFTDDDVVADDRWLDSVRAAAVDGVGCVTGLVPSAELESRWQHYFERRIAWGAALVPQRFRRSDDRGPLYPFSAGIFGTGANFAITRTAYATVGPFDEALGAGTRTRGGEDLDYFVRLIRAGIDIAYEPAAIIWHVHRPDEESFRAQYSGYGVGFGAYAAKLLLQPRTAWEFLRRIPGGARKLRSETDRAQNVGGVPQEYVALEWRGMLRGPWAYVREAVPRALARRRRGRA